MDGLQWKRKTQTWKELPSEMLKTKNIYIKVANYGEQRKNYECIMLLGKNAIINMNKIDNYPKSRMNESLVITSIYVLLTYSDW